MAHAVRSMRESDEGAFLPHVGESVVRTEAADPRFRRATPVERFHIPLRTLGC